MEWLEDGSGRFKQLAKESGIEIRLEFAPKK